jgi:uncharacterized protein
MSGYAHFELYKDEAGEHRWRLRSINGEEVAASGEGFGSDRDAERACHGVIDAVTAITMQTAPNLAIVREDTDEHRVVLGSRESGVVGGEHAIPPAPGQPGGPPADLGSPETPPATTAEIEEAEAAAAPADPPATAEPPKAPPEE